MYLGSINSKQIIQPETINKISDQIYKHILSLVFFQFEWKCFELRVNK